MDNKILDLEETKKITKNLIAELRKYEEKIKGTTTMFDDLKIAMANYNKELTANKDFVSVYAKALEKLKKEQESMSVNTTQYVKNYGISEGLNKWRAEEYAKISGNNTLSLSQQQTAVSDLDNLYGIKYAQESAKKISDINSKITSEVSDTLGEILMDFDNFDDSLKKLTRELLKYLINNLIDSLLNKGKVINATGGNLLNNLLEGAGGGLLSNIFANGSGAGKTNGFVQATGGALTIARKFLLGFHSGGVVPAGASYNLAGTQEQLAILKGGERVLSPGENVQYESKNPSQGGVNFVNLNVKAWDSKDVSKYLKENKDLIHQMMFEGIKYNNQGLRLMVRNA